MRPLKTCEYERAEPAGSDGKKYHRYETNADQESDLAIKGCAIHLEAQQNGGQANADKTPHVPKGRP